MDPNITLEELRDLAARILALEIDRLTNASTLGGELAETFQGLDDWLSMGGFLPSAWHGAEAR